MERRRWPGAIDRARYRDPALWRKTLVIAVVTAVPPWMLNVLVMGWLFGFGGDDPGSAWLTTSLPMVLIPLLIVALDALVVVALAAHGQFRADRWWLAGGLFVLAAVGASVAVEAASADSGFFLLLMLSLLDGHWLLTFAVGSLSWRRLAGTYIPVEWVSPADEGE